MTRITASKRAPLAVSATLFLALALPSGLHAATSWDVVEDGWACAYKSAALRILKVFEEGDMTAAKTMLAAYIAQKRCVALPKGSVVISPGGEFNCKDCTLAVLLNQYHHDGSGWKFKAYWVAPARFLWPVGFPRE